MKSVHLLLILLGLFIGACGDAQPSQEMHNSEPSIALGKSETNAESAPTQVAQAIPTAQTVANHSSSQDSKAERQKIDKAVDYINENIGSYSNQRSEVSYNGTDYTVVKYSDKNGFLIKSETSGGPRRWAFYALPNADSEDQLIYGSSYQKTDDPYSPITRSIYHLGTLMNAPDAVIFINQDGELITNEKELVQERIIYQEALLEFM